MILKKLLRALTRANQTTGVSAPVMDNRLIEQVLKSQEKRLELQQQQLELQHELLRAQQALQVASCKRPKPDAWQVASSAATVLALVASIIVAAIVYNQTQKNAVTVYRQTQDNAALQDQAARYSSITELSLDVDKLIADSPKLAPCFRDGDCPPDLSPVERRQAQELAVYIVDFYQYLHTQLINLGYGPPDGHFVLRGDADENSSNDSWITWSETIMMGFKGSKVACDALISGRDAYSVQFVDAAASRNVCTGLQPL